jgi:hypothetical protein
LNNSRRIAEVNLELGIPTVPEALKNLKNCLTTYKRQGAKAVIIIHGYGSTGTGGEIKAAVGRCLGEKSMSGIVRTFAGGEHWISRRKEMLAMCRGLEDHERRISGNDGITIVILR